MTAYEKTLTNALKMYEEKLKEYMGEDEYTEFAHYVAKMTFFAEMCACPNDEFKRFVFEHWGEITAPVKLNGGEDDDT